MHWSVSVKTNMFRTKAFLFVLECPTQSCSKLNPFYLGWRNHHINIAYYLQRLLYCIAMVQYSPIECQHFIWNLFILERKVALLPSPHAKTSFLNIRYFNCPILNNRNVTYCIHYNRRDNKLEFLSMRSHSWGVDILWVCGLYVAWVRRRNVMGAAKVCQGVEA